MKYIASWSGGKDSKHMNDGWISVEERLPEEKVNPVSQDFYEYQVTAKFGNVKDVRHYKYGNGHWWHGPGIVDKYVIAWRENPEPYRPGRSSHRENTGVTGTSQGSRLIGAGEGRSFRHISVITL